MTLNYDWKQQKMSNDQQFTQLNNFYRCLSSLIKSHNIQHEIKVKIKFYTCWPLRAVMDKHNGLRRQISQYSSRIMLYSYRTCLVCPRKLNKLFHAHPGLLNRFNRQTDDTGVSVETVVIAVKVLVEDDDTQNDDCRPENDPDGVKTAKHFGCDVQHHNDSSFCRHIILYYCFDTVDLFFFSYDYHLFVVFYFCRCASEVPTMF